MSITAGLGRRANSSTLMVTPSAPAGELGMSHSDARHYLPALTSKPLPPTLPESEVARLRIRIEALEHLIIILLAASGAEDLETLRGLAGDIPFWSDLNLNAE